MGEIKTIIGDILSPNTDENKPVMVCHQVNCKGKMGAGLALQVKRKYPWIYKHYQDKCELIANGIGGVGDVQMFSCITESGYLLANIFGQEGYGRNRRYTDYDALRQAFQHIAFFYPTYTVRIPYLMGCGLAGGDWNIVSKIINEELVEGGIEVEIWKLPENKL